jgi:pimeloyl-ACP methyl ester carboxylesterase
MTFLPVWTDSLKGNIMVDFHFRFALCGFLLTAYPGFTQGQEPPAARPEAQSTLSSSKDVTFQAHDGVEMFGRLVLPKDARPRAIVIYVQTAEGATIDQKRALGKDKTFNYFDLYRLELVKRGIGFFSYEGRGIRMGDAPPRYEKVDRAVFNTGTLDNKVKDAMAAVETVRKQLGLRETPVLLMGASEGTLIAAEAASRNPASIQGIVLYGALAWNMKQNFAFILSDGDYLRYRRVDKDNNGAITKEEWESVIKGTDFGKADQNGDGSFTVEDVRIVNKKLLDAVENDDFAALNDWGQAYAGVALPDRWFENHFSHADMWSFLKRLDLPVGVFHGDRDNNTSMAAVKDLERKAKDAGLAKIEFHYFEGLDHTLNISQYFVSGAMPPGHQAIFRYIDRIAPKP